VKLDSEFADDERFDSISNQLEGCSALRSSVGITPELDVVPCTFWKDLSVGNLQEKSFSEIWRGSEADLFRTKLNGQSLENGVCKSCEMKGFCLGGCPEEELVNCHLDYIKR